MDQPPYDENNQPPINQGDQSTATDHEPTGQQPVTLEAAADRLGITVNAVRQRLKRGTIAGDRTSAGWVVFLPTNQPTSDDRGRVSIDQPATGSRPATNQPADHAGIAPLADLIADLHAENVRLASAATLWQNRAMQLQERLEALEAGPISQPTGSNAETAAPDGPGTPEAPGPVSGATQPKTVVPRGWSARLRAWLRDGR